jgi:predicted transcriptional regulator
MAEITEDQPHYNTLSTIVRNLEEKDTLPLRENASILPHHCYRGLQKGFMNTAIDNYFNSSYKNMVSFFCQEKISAKELHEILAMIENPKEEK